MLCRLLLIFSLLHSLSDGLGFSTPSTTMIYRRGRRQSKLTLAGWFDFKPFQGSGSAKEELDEQWEAQQAILRARRNDGLNKETLKQKYGAAKPKVQEDRVEESKIESTNESSQQSPAIKLPWEK